MRNLCVLCAVINILGCSLPSRQIESEHYQDILKENIRTQAEDYHSKALSGDSEGVIAYEHPAAAALRGGKPPSDRGRSLDVDQITLHITSISKVYQEEDCLSAYVTTERHHGNQGELGSVSYAYMIACSYDGGSNWQFFPGIHPGRGHHDILYEEFPILTLAIPFPEYIVKTKVPYSELHNQRFQGTP